MSLDYRHGIFVLELIVYIPTLIIALYVVSKHGYSKSSGWITFVIFALARIVGSSCYLATLADPSSTDLYVAYAICTAIGLSPLTISCVGLLSRANESIRRQSGEPVNQRMFTLIGLATLVAVVLSIIGEVKSFNAEIQGSVSTLTRVGVIIFLGAWIGLMLLLCFITSRIKEIGLGERRVVAAVGLSTPLLLVRVIYALLAAFSTNSDFNMLTGDPTIMLVMAVLEEIIICLVCLGTGLTLTKQKPTNHSEAYAPVG